MHTDKIGDWGLVFINEEEGFAINRKHIEEKEGGACQIYWDVLIESNELDKRQLWNLQSVMLKIICSLPFLVLCFVCPLLTHVTIERALQVQEFPLYKCFFTTWFKIMLADCALSLYDWMFVVWSIFTNLMCTVQIVHATRTVLLTNSKYRSCRE